MVNSTVTLCLLLLGAVCLTNCAPAPLPKGDLVILADAAKLLYDTLSQAIQEAQLQQASTTAPPPPGNNINNGTGTGLNGNGNFNFYDEVNGLHVNGR